MWNLNDGFTQATEAKTFQHNIGPALSVVGHRSGVQRDWNNHRSRRSLFHYQNRSSHTSLAWISLAYSCWYWRLPIKTEKQHTLSSSTQPFYRSLLSTAEIIELHLRSPIKMQNCFLEAVSMQRSLSVSLWFVWLPSYKPGKLPPRCFYLVHSTVLGKSLCLHSLTCSESLGTPTHN